MESASSLSLLPQPGAPLKNRFVSQFFSHLRDVERRHAPSCSPFNGHKRSLFHFHPRRKSAPAACWRIERGRKKSGGAAREPCFGAPAPLSISLRPAPKVLPVHGAAARSARASVAAVVVGARARAVTSPVPCGRYLKNDFNTPSYLVPP